MTHLRSSVERTDRGPRRTELPRDSVVNVAALVTVDKDDLDERIGQVPDYLMQDVGRGLLTSPSSVKTKTPRDSIATEGSSCSGLKPVARVPLVALRWRSGGAVTASREAQWARRHRTSVRSDLCR